MKKLKDNLVVHTPSNHHKVLEQTLYMKSIISRNLRNEEVPGMVKFSQTVAKHRFFSVLIKESVSLAKTVILITGSLEYLKRC